MHRESELEVRFAVGEDLDELTQLLCPYGTFQYFHEQLLLQECVADIRTVLDVCRGLLSELLEAIL